MGYQLVVFVGNSFLAFLVLSYALAVSSQQSGVYTTLVNLIIYQLPGEHHHQPEREVSGEDGAI